LTWEFKKIAENKLRIIERQEYKAKITTLEECIEDDLIPLELKISYIKNGTNLQCPRGTESERRSWCLG
jgi:hypothetical protein